MKYLGSTSGAVTSVRAVVMSQMKRKEVLADCVVSGRGSRRRGAPVDAVLASISRDGVGLVGPEGFVRD